MGSMQRWKLNLRGAGEAEVALFDSDDDQLQRRC